MPHIYQILRLIILALYVDVVSLLFHDRYGPVYYSVDSRIEPAKNITEHVIQKMHFYKIF